MDPAKNWLFVETLDFPLARAGVTRVETDLRRLTRLLRESALLLEASRISSDPDFQAGSLDLAIRTMRAASAAVERSLEPELKSTSRRGTVVAGPWSGSEAELLPVAEEIAAAVPAAPAPSL